MSQTPTTRRTRAPGDPKAPQNRLLFWFTAVLSPEAASFEVGSPRALAGRVDLTGQAEANDRDGGTPDRDAA
ncbi:MAG: hypothetical protein RIC56_20340 [Pseudomonadales bacterium]